MCETFWMRCHCVEVEDWCPTDVCEELRVTELCPQVIERKGAQVGVEDASLLLFEAHKDMDIKECPALNVDISNRLSHGGHTRRSLLEPLFQRFCQRGS